MNLNMIGTYETFKLHFRNFSTKISLHLILLLIFVEDIKTNKKSRRTLRVTRSDENEEIRAKN